MPKSQVNNNMVLVSPLLIFLVLPTVIHAVNLGDGKGCSFHRTYSCHEDAECIDINQQSGEWTCECLPGLEGDGFIRNGPNNTGCGKPRCRFQSDCLSIGLCNGVGECECKPGFHGDGKFVCLDIDECIELAPCHKHAHCTNTEGSFICTCDEEKNYVGDGFNCIHHCDVHSDCEDNEMCDFGTCVCKSGYVNDSVSTECVDIDECSTFNECHEKADCINSDGSYSCQCSNGYEGDGLMCKAIPTNCQEIKDAKPTSKSGEYEIDPDGIGPLSPTMVICQMRPWLGITVFLVSSRRFTVTKKRTLYNVQYRNNIADIRAVVENSGFCYQYVKIRGRRNFHLRNDEEDYWIDGENTKMYTWGGSPVNGTCLCGAVGRCQDRSSPCNCDGTSPYCIDDGKIINSNNTKLPVLAANANPDGGYGYIDIESVKCATVTFDIHKTCHELKFDRYTRITKNGAQWVDVDGPDRLFPMLAYCDMTSYDHVGITEITSTNPYATDVTYSGSIAVKYIVDKDQLEKLLEISPFCMQEVSYECRNSRLLNNGDRKGWFTDIWGNDKDYWPGGLRRTDKCACGVLGVCDNTTFGCSCDVKDGIERKDFGAVYDKEDLPIGWLTFTEIGGDSWGRYYVGSLKCSEREFGIPPTCQRYAENGYVDSYVYSIDPDGPPNTEYPGVVNEPPFPVFCDISVNPPYATTVVYHNHMEEIVVAYNGVYEFQYLEANVVQLELLVTRAVSCTQTFSYECSAAPLHSGDPSSPSTWWSTKDGRRQSYFNGDGSEPEACACALTSTCADPALSCNCDIQDTTVRHDEGVLNNKEDLPMMMFNFTDIVDNISQARVRVGALKCREIYPNCGARKIFNNKYRLESEAKMTNGFYTIAPDTDLEPFSVHCLDTKTTIETYIHDPDPIVGEPDTGVSKCYAIHYMSNGFAVSSEQVQALVMSSSHCGQKLSQTCTNAPLTYHSNFSTCDEVLQPGWAGSLGENMCACALTGACADGPDSLCNCDLVDGVEREDGSWILNRHRLAVCRVCVALDPASWLTISPQYRSVQPIVSDLFCDIGGINGAKTCHDWRNFGMKTSGTQMVEPRVGAVLDPFPVYCAMHAYPPMGITEIRPKQPRIPVPEIGFNISIEYFAYSLEVLRATIIQHRFCTQELYLECQDSSLELGGTYGWYSIDGDLQVGWAGNDEGTPTCAGGSCNCNKAGFNKDGGLITKDSLLPVLNVVLGPAPGNRTLVVGTVKCYDLFPTCHEIHRAEAKTNPMGDHTYTIDPDQAGGNDPFPVKCFFKYRSYGITKVEVDQGAGQVTGYPLPESYMHQISYESSNYDQIHSLAIISQWCIQPIQVFCLKTALMLSDMSAHGYYRTYGGIRSTSFGVPGDSSVAGCACVATGSCPGDNLCNCDGTGSLKSDSGFETNKTVLPIVSLTFGTQLAQGASAMFVVSDVQCGPKPFYLPKHCDDAYKKGYRNGEVLIWPSSSVEPFLVHCNMNRMVPGKGVTIVHSKHSGGEVVTFGGSLTLKYYASTISQLRKLVKKSKFCYQPFKYTCRNTKFVMEDAFYWLGGDGSSPRTFVGNGQWDDQECNCGTVGQCGGSEPRQVLMSMDRKCNCEAGDNVTRADAGVFNKKEFLPMSDIIVQHTGLSDSYGYVTVGNLYCSEKELDLNECSMRFHDCHEHARCIKQEGTYDCRCNPGWRGLGRNYVWANGRNCYDDDECALLMCHPDRATCTNLPGDFYCTCKSGFEKRGHSKHNCEDIDECARGTHTCHAYARCINLVGSYDCRCNLNYRGDGHTCTPMATCTCFGDPHCFTSDMKLVDYQGECQYVMSRDNCDNLDQEPFFELLTTFSRGNAPTRAPASWVKQVTFKIHSYEITLMQRSEVRVNGRTVNLPFIRHDMYIRKFGNYVEVYTTVGIEVTWDGKESVQLHTSGQWQEKLCGLCGNYNGDPNDDMIIGPQCPKKAGNLTDNFNDFGDSWVTSSSVAEFPECAANCSRKDDNELCTGSEYLLAASFCNKLYDTSGIFKECLLDMDGELLACLRRSCIYDLCRVNGDPIGAICRNAETLVQICLRMNSPVQSFRTKAFCEITCPQNTEYNIRGNTEQVTCYDIITNNTVIIENPKYEEGCFCKEGFFLDGDGDVCVASDDCGCVYNGDYYRLGDDVTLDGCGEVATCTRNNTMVTSVVVCHENATCFLKDGVYGCHCDDDMHGDGVTICIPDPCLDNPCGENENCLVDPDRDLGYECLCAMGFMGKCNNCTDIDECNTYESLCPKLSDCVNTVGSYDCKCHKGYIFYNGACQDYNECENAKADNETLCGDNSRCSNRMGTYECPCCSGFEKDANGTCVASNDGSVGERCCTCEIDICNVPGKVCGEDFIEYDSIRDMMIARCERGLPPRKQNAMDYSGSCKGSCSKVKCPKHQVCETVTIDGRSVPTCKCKPCSKEDTISGKVCTSKIDMYDSICDFKIMQCFLDHEATLLSSLKPCHDKHGASPLGGWGAWGECSVTCGKGTREKRRPTYRELTAEESEKHPVSLTTECYMEPCPGSPCLDFICYQLFSKCVVENDQPFCECPACTNIGFEPVCGFVQLADGDIVTDMYASICELQKEACENEYVDAGVINEGHCDLSPVNCTRVPEKNAQYLRAGFEDEYVSTKMVHGYGCEGGCGNVKHDCCRPVDTQRLPIEFVNEFDSEDRIVEEIEMVKSCECVDIEDLDVDPEDLD